MTKLQNNFEPKLELIAQAGFERNLVRACFDNLEATGPLRFNNFAYSLRELLRHVFHRLAPDMSVKKCCWYKPDLNRPGF